MKETYDYKKADFMLPCDHPVADEAARKLFSPAVEHVGVFNDEELTWIWKFAFKGCKKVRYNTNGTIFVDGNLHEIYFKFKDRFDTMLGPDAEKSPQVAGNFYISPGGYGLHNDNITKDEYDDSLLKVWSITDKMRRFVGWKNVVIPLWIGSSQQVIHGGQIGFFKQRYLGWSAVLNHHSAHKNISTLYPHLTDYSKLDFYDENGKLIPFNDVPFDEETWKKYFSGTPRDRFRGLELESIYEWKPGNAIVFDAAQLHASNPGDNEHGRFNMKMGLRLIFLKELDGDLLNRWQAYQMSGG